MNGKAAKITAANRLTFTAARVYSARPTSIPGRSGTLGRFGPSQSSPPEIHTAVTSCSFCLDLGLWGFFLTVTLHV